MYNLGFLVTTLKKIPRAATSFIWSYKGRITRIESINVGVFLRAQSLLSLSVYDTLHSLSCAQAFSLPFLWALLRKWLVLTLCGYFLQCGLVCLLCEVVIPVVGGSLRSWFKELSELEEAHLHLALLALDARWDLLMRAEFGRFGFCCLGGSLFPPFSMHFLLDGESRCLNCWILWGLVLFGFWFGKAIGWIWLSL